MFHHFHGGRHRPGQGSISSEDLENIICFAGPERILPPDAWLEKTRAGRLEPDDLCLTFDDALLCQFDLALPVLERRGLRAFWFVQSCVFRGQPSKFEIHRAFRTTCFRNVDEFYEVFFRKISELGLAARAAAVVRDDEIARFRDGYAFYSVDDVKYRFIRDRALTPGELDDIMAALMEERGTSVEALSKNLWMSEDHLRYLSRSGHEVGLHSYTHPMTMAALPRAEQEREYGMNYAHLKEVCGRAPLAMAHPAGSYNEEGLDILRRLGIVCGFRSTMAPPRRDGCLNPTPLEISREDHTNILNQLRRCGAKT